MNDRIAQLEAALREIAEIAEASDGPVAKFYGMLARRALATQSGETNDT